MANLNAPDTSELPDARQTSGEVHPSAEPLTTIVQSAGVQLAAEARGQRTRGAILLVMGATASMVWWPDELVERLADAGYRVIRFDHRDTGQSTTHPPGTVRYGLEDLAGDLLAVLEAHDLERAHFVGMSLGGYLSQIVALEQPDRVQSLTLIASEPVGIDYPASGIAPGFMEHFGKMEGLNWSNEQTVTDFLLGIARLSAGSAQPFDESAAMRRIKAEIDRTNSMQSAFNHSAISGEADTSLTAASLKQPVLIIHGSEDPIVDAAAARTIHSAVSGSRMLLLEGRGHELLARDVPAIAQGIIDLAQSAELGERP